MTEIKPAPLVVATKVARDALKRAESGKDAVSLPASIVAGLLQVEDELNAERAETADLEALVERQGTLLRDTAQALRGTPTDGLPDVSGIPGEVATLVAARTGEADANAPWLTAAHALCSDAGIPQGHIAERLQALRDRIAPAKPVTIINGLEVEFVTVIDGKSYAALKTQKNLCSGCFFWRHRTSSSLMRECHAPLETDGRAPCRGGRIIFAPYPQF